MEKIDNIIMAQAAHEALELEYDECEQLCPAYERDALAKRVEELRDIVKEREARVDQWREWGDKVCQSLIDARDRIAGLEAENARLREALEYYANDHAVPNDGPWGIDSKDFGDVARKTLEGE